jgi:peptide/nickel transport system substrate-binding protein
MKRGLSRLLAGLSAIALVATIVLGGAGADPSASLSARRREGLKTLSYDGLGIFASERPVYGGTLRAEIGAPVSLLEPAGGSTDASEAELVSLTYETVVRVDRRGDVQPLLAETWERDATMRRWKFHLRAGVHFQDGTALTPQSAVAELINADADWRVTPTSDGLQIETPSAAPEFPATLAERKYVLVRRSKEAAGGTGPFKIESWEAGKHVLLMANPDYWGGRPFLDSVEVQLGRAARERMIDLQVGKADVVELPAEMARRASDEKIRIEVTPPVELLALIYPDGSAGGAGQAAGTNRAAERSAETEVRLRQAISRSIDRAAIVNLVLQKEGEPAGGLLPQWISGTEFLFSSAADPAAARALVKEIAPAATLVLGYDSGDALEQAVAERIAVNAREAGITVTSIAIPPAPLAPGSAARAGKPKYDARLVRVNLVSPLPRPALAGLLAELSPVLGSADSGLPESADTAEIYAREKAALETWRVVPIAHLPRVYGLGPRVRNWSISPGTAMNGLPLADVWLKREAQ